MFLNHKEAKSIILELIDAGNDGALVQVQDGGDKVDVVLSHVAGRESEVMTLREAEHLMDRAIRRAWKAMTGGQIHGDPVEFINTDK